VAHENIRSAEKHPAICIEAARMKARRGAGGEARARGGCTRRDPRGPRAREFRELGISREAKKATDRNR